MLPAQFFGQNVHFAISLFAALVFFAAFWLYFDAWKSSKRKIRKDILKWLGFLMLAVSFIVEATVIEQPSLGHSAFSKNAALAAAMGRLIGYIIIVAGQLIDPLQKVPKTIGVTESFMSGNKNEKSGSSESGSKNGNQALLSTGNYFGLIFGLPVAALAVAVLYYRRATKGLENHLKPVALAFALLVGFELLSISSLWQGSTNPHIYNLVRVFGPIWVIAQAFLLAAVIVLGRWVWRYLVERFMSQLFMIFVTMIVGLFLAITLTFTFLLTRNIQNDALNNLKTASNVLQYALVAKQSETNANAETVAQNPQVVAAVAAADHKALAALNSNFLANKKQSSLVITDVNGQVLLRAEEPERWGDSISSDTLVQRALVGTAKSSITTKEAVVAPKLYIKSTVPIRDSKNTIIGTASVSLVADSALTDGIKNATNLDSSIYSGNTLSATTLVAPDGVSRSIGTKQTNKTIKEIVLVKGEPYKGEVSLQGQQYLAVYAPLKDADNTIVGMLFIGQPQSSVLRIASHSTELTFLAAAVLLVSSIVPAYMVARQLSKQLD